MRIMKKSKNIIKFFILLLSCVLIVETLPVRAYADSLDVKFDLAQYKTGYNKAFCVGVTIEGDKALGEYEVELAYNDRYLSYVSGADKEENGKIILSGDANGTETKYLLVFQAVSGGDTEIEITGAKAKTEDGKDLELKTPSSAKVYLSVNTNAIISALNINGAEVEEFTPDVFTYEITVPNNVEDLEVTAEAAPGVSAIVSDTRLTPGENEIFVRTEGKNDARNTYLLIVNRLEAGEGDDANADDGNGLPIGNNNSIIDVVVLSLIIVILAILLLKKKKPAPENEGENPAENVPDVSENKAEGPVTADSTVSAEESAETGKKKSREERKKARAEKKQAKESGNVAPAELAPADAAVEEDENKEPPVISIQDVSMLFRVSTQNVSGLKEFLIQKVKGRISYKRFYALRHISFDVFQGEVVGIIGTNGSGKSTLLKIVSGALKPTEGRVVVNQSKVQLLTLGTGFDMELTAKENVYLNGSIIGYSKEYIDSVYDDIVKFAELEEFMEEKVKNFSSGMVSRLGFAIATIGDAPEILILDEVLSVGDEFFRKKSLERVNEMIHGGSTVLMVSHSMATIRDNCTKVVWIEKGDLKMIGDAKTVCRAYQTMGNTET